MSLSAQNNSKELILMLMPLEARQTLALLKQAGFLAKVCPNFSVFCDQMSPLPGAALIGEEAFFPGAIEKLIKILQPQPAWSDFPFIIFTSNEKNTAARLKADGLLGKLSNVTLLERPLRPQTMLSAVQFMLRARRRQYETRDLIQEIQTLNQALEQRVQERTAALKESNEQMEAFVYSVSHDLRGPLRTIKGFSEILRDQYAPDLDASGQDYVNRIIKSAKYMDSLTQDLLGYSRLSRAEFNLENLETGICLDAVILQMSEEIGQKKAKLKIKKPLSSVLAHSTPLEQIFTNLISNALKFSKPNERPALRIWATEKNDHVGLFFEDKGIGIAPEHHERIFRIFERLHSPNEYPGTGIGLALVKKAAERMNGSVGVESELDGGSKFWVELPKANN
ncbi:MAG: ATP-binding protein [Verrucomicrobiota bacterium]|nr:ATP-binding protein [Verrucomicrobiota bacterium]